MKIMAFATALTLAFGALTLPLSENGYSFADKAAVSAQAGTNDFKYDSADFFTADSLLDRAILPDGERIFDHDPILAYTPTTRDWLFKQTAEEVVDNSWLISADTLWLNAEKAFSFEFVGEDSVFTRQQFVYETIIMDYLTYQYQSDEFKSDIEKSTTKFMYKIEKKVLDNEILSDEAFDNKIKGMSKEDAADFAKEQNYLKRFNEVNVSAYDALIDGAETAKDYFKKLSKLMALQEASTTRLDFLQKIKDNTDDKALIKAIDDITAKYNDELSNVVWNEFLQTGMETFNGVVWDSIKDFFKKKFKIEIPGFSSIKLGMAGIDWAFNEKGMAESRIQLTILYIIHADVMQTYIDMRDSYINSGTEESAQEFVNAYSQYLAFIAYSSGITKEYLGETLIDGAYNSIKNLFSSTNQTAYNDYCSALNSEISICQTLDKYVGLAKDFYNKMSGYNASEDTKVPESAAIGTRFTSGYLTYEVTGEGEVGLQHCDSSAEIVNIPECVFYDGVDYTVTSVMQHAFIEIVYGDGHCRNNKLKTVIIPHSVYSINNESFEYCSSLNSITIPNGVISIGKFAFNGCDSLKSIIIPETIEYIDSYAFGNNEGLESITILSSKVKLDYQIFDCSNLKEIIINEDNPNYCSVNGILYNKEKTELIKCPKKNSDICILDTTQVIGKYAFSGCSELSNIIIPSSVINISFFAFRGTNVSTITVETNNKFYTSIDGVLYNKDKTILIQYPIGNTNTSFEIPNKVNKIEKSAFVYSQYLKKVTISSNVSSLDYSFNGSKELTDIIIPKNVTNIGYFTFANCPKLENVYYSGSEADWNKIHFDSCNEMIQNATIHYNYSLHEHSYAEEITKQPTCTEEGEKTFTCDCGDTYTETIPAKGHTEVIDKAVAATCTTDGKTEGSHCSVCGEVIKAQTVIKATGHKYDDGKITKQPTCTETGVKTYTCSDCGDTYTETIPAKGHTEVIDKAVAATCTTDGKTEGSHCSVCGEVIRAQTVIKATGHNFGSWNTTKSATCTENGTQTRKCAACGKTETKTIPAKGHTSSGWIVDKQPAVGVKGSKHKECTVCGKILEKAEIPALAATDISGASVKLSTTSYTYNGKAKKPAATVTLNGKTLKKNVDYTVKYSSNTAIGKAKVTITGKGNYKGTVSKTFKILPAKQTIAKLTAQKKGFAAKWTKDTNVTGYQIQYDVKSDLKSAKSTYVKTNTTYKKTISGLKAKKTYYVRVRSYKTVGGVKYYGSWSAVKSVKTK